MICPHCAFPNDPKALVCSKCKKPLVTFEDMPTAPHRVRPPEWMQGPATGSPLPLAQQRTVELRLPEEVLEEARQKEAAGDLRGAFLLGQELLIEHYGDLPDATLVLAYVFMARVSLRQDKRERATKYLHKAKALRPGDPEVLKLIAQLASAPPPVISRDLAEEPTQPHHKPVVLPPPPVPPPAVVQPLAPVPVLKSQPEVLKPPPADFPVLTQEETSQVSLPPPEVDAERIRQKARLEEAPQAELPPPPPPEPVVHKSTEAPAAPAVLAEKPLVEFRPEAKPPIPPPSPIPAPGSPAASAPPAPSVVEKDPAQVVAQDWYKTDAVSLETGAPVSSEQGRLVWAAGFWIRALAFAIDAALVLAIIFVCALIVSLVIGGGFKSIMNLFQQRAAAPLVVLAVTAAMLLVYLTLFAWMGGQTVGKMVLALRVVGLTGHSLSLGQALRRGLGMLVGGLAGLAGFLWAGFDLRRRAWHDWIAATLVIRLRPPRGAA